MILNNKNDILFAFTSSFDSGYFTPWWFSLAFILCIFLFVLPVYALLAFLALTILLALGILLYVQNEFFSFLILFIYSGAITVLFIFLLQFYAINHDYTRVHIPYKSYNLPIVNKAILGSCFLLLFAEGVSLLWLSSNINENWEILNNRIFADENLIKNLNILFLAHSGQGFITITIGCVLLLGLIVVLCIVGSNNKTNND